MARPNYRKLVNLDLEKVSLAEHFPSAAYDAIVCADVLEHLREPGRVLDQLPALLAPSGRLLISIPNVGYAGVVAGLLCGEFKYRPTGLLDETHLRFFTRSTLLDLLAEHGFGATALHPLTMQPASTELAGAAFAVLEPAVLQAVLDAPDALVYQFIVEAVRGAHAPGIAAKLARPPFTTRVQAFWASPGEEYGAERCSTSPATSSRCAT